MDGGRLTRRAGTVTGQNTMTGDGDGGQVDVRQAVRQLPCRVQADSRTTCSRPGDTPHLPSTESKHTDKTQSLIGISTADRMRSAI